MKTRSCLSLVLILAIGVALPQPAKSATPVRAQSSCPGSLDPTSIDADREAGSQVVTVNAPQDGCLWEVTVDVPWLTVEPTNGYGPGQVTVSWDFWEGFCGNTRAGTVRVRQRSGGGEGRTNSPGGGQRSVVVTQKTELCNDFLCAVGNSSPQELLECLLFFLDEGNPNAHFETFVIWLNLVCLANYAGNTVKLRQVRDEILAKSPLGRKYTRLYYDHLPEAMAILAANPALYRRAVWSVARLAPIYASLNTKEAAAINPADIDEIDGLLADVAVHARLELKRTLEQARRDLRDTSVQANFGIAVRPEAPTLLSNQFPASAKGVSRARELDEAYRLLLSPETIALAARGSTYVEWAQRHREEILSLVVTNPSLLRSGIATLTKLTAIHRSIVETGRARMSDDDVEAIDGFLAAVADRAGPDLARVISQGRRDLRAPELLSRFGVDLAEGVRPGEREKALVSQDAALTTPQPGAPPQDLAIAFGGSGVNSAGTIITDSAGNTYVTGMTAATNFPTTNALQATYGGGDADAFVAKLAPDGRVLYATYLGGSGRDAGVGLALDAAGNLYVAGLTNSTNFPVANALQPAKRGQDTSDAFLAKLDASGSTLVYATFLGGTGADFGSSVAVDAAGNAYIAGLTTSTDFAAVSGFQNSNHGSADAFVAKVNAAGSALVYSTYFGGTGHEGAAGIALDAMGAAYVTGVTTSADFPVLGPIQGTYSGLFDAFAAKLAPNGSTLVYSTFLGGTGAEGGSGIVVDGDGNAYVAGTTSSADFPVARALQPSSGGGFTDTFVVKLNAAGSAFVFSTYLGGNDEDRGYRIGIDGSNRVYVTGLTISPNFPTRNAVQAGPRGDVDGFATLYNRDGSALVYSTYLGGSALDAGTGIAVDASGNACISGISGSQDFPTSRQPHDPYDVFALRLGAVPAVTPPYVASVASVAKPGKPYRVKILGQNFQVGAQVFIGDDATPWPQVKRKGGGTLILKQVDARFPPGVPTRIRIVNSNGGEANTYFAR